MRRGALQNSAVQALAAAGAAGAELAAWDGGHVLDVQELLTEEGKLRVRKGGGG